MDHPLLDGHIPPNEKSFRNRCRAQGIPLLLFVHGREYPVHALFENWYIIHYGYPDAGGTYSEVLVDQQVSHTHNVLPRYLGTLPTDGFRKTGGRLPDSFELEYHSSLYKLILRVGIVAKTGVFLDFLYSSQDVE